MLKRFQDLTWKVVNLVNPPTKTQRITRNAVVSRVILKDFMESVIRMDQKGFFAGSLGEVSVRTSGGRFLITPGDSPVCLLAEDSICTAAIEKEQEVGNEGFPHHLPWHRLIYKNTQAKAAMLCQPAYATLLANQLQKPKKDIFLEANSLVDQVQVALEEDVEKIEMGDEGILFIKNVGILMWGASLSELLNRAEILERLSLLSMVGK